MTGRHIHHSVKKCCLRSGHIKRFDDTWAKSGIYPQCSPMICMLWHVRYKHDIKMFLLYSARCLDSGIRTSRSRAVLASLWERDRTELETQSMILVDRRYKTGGIDLRVSFAPRHASHGTCNSTFVDMENTSLGDSIQVGQKCFPLPRSNQCQWTDRSWRRLQIACT